MREYMAIFITASYYGLLAAGLYLIFGRSIRKVVLEIRMRKRLRARRRALKEPGLMTRHLDLMLSTVFRGKISAKFFCILTLCIFVFVYAAAIKVLDPSAAVISGIMISIFPYLIIRIRLENIRKKSSFEGETFIGEFLTQYRICRFNAFETMSKMAEDPKTAETCTRLLLKILYITRNNIADATIKEAADSFTYAINTNWSRMFAYNLKTAIKTGENVSLAMEDVFLQLREARILGEERVRLNAEATRMVIFLIPVMYAATVLISIKYVGLPWNEYLRNQFGTSQGFMLILAILVMFLVNIIIVEVVNNQKFDF